MKNLYRSSEFKKMISVIRSRSSSLNGMVEMISCDSLLPVIMLTNISVGHEYGKLGPCYE